MVFKTLSKEIYQLTKQRGFLEPTLPQKMGIPDILSGKNVLIIAPTGIGKTETAFLPVLDMIHRRKNKPISLLYITPLKSLNRDMLDRLFWWADKLDVEIAVRHGDTTQQERKQQRENPSNILITTPESLGALLTGKIARTHLSNVKYVIVDEIHELIENKRGIQLSLLLERLRNISGDFQRIGLSATVGSPRKTANFLGENVKVIRADAEKKLDVSVELPEKTKLDQDIADRIFLSDDNAARLRRINNLIQKDKSSIVFTNTRQMSEVLSSRLRQMNKDFKQEVHHSSISKDTRIKREDEFKKGQINALIATSSLELGIDIGSIDLVVQYMSPRQVSKIIQRAGRAGHSIKEISKAIIIADKDDDLFECLSISKQIRLRNLEKIKVHEQALDVFCSQIAGMAIEEYDIESDVVYNVLTRAYPFKSLSKQEFLGILNFLARIRIVWLTQIGEDNFNIRRSRKTWSYYFENLSTIPDQFSFKVVSIVEQEPVGRLDQAFVSEYLEEGSAFIFGGRAWKVLNIETDKIVVEPTDDLQSAIPAWEGELIPVPLDVTKEVGELRKKVLKDDIQDLKKDYNADENSIKNAKKLIEKQKKYFIPTFDHWYMEKHEDFVVIHNCCGSLINDTLGRYISSLITNETGVSVRLKIDPYRIIIKTMTSCEKIKEYFNDDFHLESILKMNLERSSLFRWRFIHVGKRMGILSSKTDYKHLNLSKIISIYFNSPVYNETMKEILKDKMNTKGAKKILEMIQNKEIKISISKKKLSPLGEIGLTKQFSEVMKPKFPEHEIFRAFKKRLLHTKLKLACTHCCNYSLTQKVTNMDEFPVCPKCHSGLITITAKYKRPLELLKKYKKSKQDKSIKLSKQELKEAEQLKRTANLMLTYGRKYAMVHAGRGIGTETAARILAKIPKNEEELLKLIFEAERNYQKTKKYWSD